MLNENITCPNCDTKLMADSPDVFHTSDAVNGTVVFVSRYVCPDCGRAYRVHNTYKLMTTSLHALPPASPCEF